MSDPLLSLPIHTVVQEDPQLGYKYMHSLSTGISPTQPNQQNVDRNPIDVRRFFRNLSRSSSHEYNPNVMARSNADADLLGVKPSATDRDESPTMPALSICSSSRSASPASNTSNVDIAAAINRKLRQKSDRAVEVLNRNSVVIARFRTQTDCAKYLQATPEAVSYHCSNKGGGVCNGLVIRPCDNSDDNEYGLFDGAEEDRPKRRPQLKPETVAILKEWLLSPEHVENPYPTAKETEMLLLKTGLDKTQLKHWFNNARKRILKPILGKKKKAAGPQAEPTAQRPVAQEKRKAAPDQKMKRPSKKSRVESHTNNSRSSGTVSPHQAALSQFGIMFGSERAGAGALNAMPQTDSMPQENTRNPLPGRFNQGGQSEAMATTITWDNLNKNSDHSMPESVQGKCFGNNNFPPQQQQLPPHVVFKQEVASMAMKEATIAFQNMEDAYAVAKKIMALLAASGSITNIEEDPRVIEATAHAKRLHSVALFKLKVSKRASEEAEKAFETMQGVLGLA
eukprot:scaffold2848_cov150-Skeletonema_menzelii.AAC.15